MDFNDYIRDMSDEELKRYIDSLTQGGALKKQGSILEEQLAQAQAMAQPSGARSYGPVAGGLNAFADILNAYTGARDTKRLRGEQGALIGKETELVAGQARMLAEAHRRKLQQEAAAKAAQTAPATLRRPDGTEQPPFPWLGGGY